MTSERITNVIWIVMKHERVSNFEGNDIVHPYNQPDKAFRHLEDALKYIKEQDLFILNWKLVGDEIFHPYDCANERHLTYESYHEGHKYYKDIYYDIIVEELI